MKNYIFDLDGTIVKNGEPINYAIGSKLKKISLTDKLIFASARPIRDMLPLIPTELHNCLMVGCNGGMVWENKSFISCSYFNKKTIKEVVDFLKTNNIPYILDGSWGYSVSENFHSFHDYLRSLSDEEGSENDIVDSGVTKLLILDGNFKKDFLKFIEVNKYNFSINYHKNDHFFDITPKSENKYSTLAAVGIEFEKSVVFGNDSNDFQMLDHAKFSVFVGSSRDYKNASLYCNINEIVEFIEIAEDAMSRSLTKYYFNKQSIAITNIYRILKLQKVVSSWVPCESDISNKLEFSEIVQLFGVSLSSLYNIALENSVFQKATDLPYKPVEDQSAKRCPESYEVNLGTLLQLKDEIELIKSELFHALSINTGIVYDRIRERISDSIHSLKKILEVIESIDIANKNSLALSKDIYDYIFFSPHVPARSQDVKVNITLPATMKMLYSNYINLEVATVECCCSIINDFCFTWSDIPFLKDLSTQIKDEINHSSILLNEYRKRGGEGAAVNSHFNFWLMARDEDIATRLYIHQKMGEWIGIDAAMMQVLSSNDADIVEVYTSILSDEINHTRLGTYWIDQYCGNDYDLIKQKAMLKRKEFNQADEGMLKFPINEEVCRLCNFKDDEIDALLERERRFGHV